jgi:hypothetical protein
MSYVARVDVIEFMFVVRVGVLRARATDETNVDDDTAIVLPNGIDVDQRDFGRFASNMIRQVIRSVVERTPTAMSIGNVYVQQTRRRRESITLASGNHLSTSYVACCRRASSLP